MRRQLISEAIHQLLAAGWTVNYDREHRQYVSTKYGNPCVITVVPAGWSCLVSKITLGQLDYVPRDPKSIGEALKIAEERVTFPVNPNIRWEPPGNIADDMFLGLTLELALKEQKRIDALKRSRSPKKERQ